MKLETYREILFVGREDNLFIRSAWYPFCEYLCLPVFEGLECKLITDVLDKYIVIKEVKYRLVKLVFEVNKKLPVAVSWYYICTDIDSPEKRESIVSKFGAYIMSFGERFSGRACI